MFNLGDKVYINTPEMEGYLVDKSIDPIEEYEVESDVQNCVFCTVRVYRPFYQYGFADFHCLEHELHKVE